METFLEQLTSTTEKVSDIISGPLVFILLGTGFFITLTLKFIQVRKLKHSFKVVAGKYDDPTDEGDVTHFQALSTALSSIDSDVICSSILLIIPFLLVFELIQIIICWQCEKFIKFFFFDHFSK